MKQLVKVRPFRNVRYGDNTYWEGQEFIVEDEERLKFFLDAQLVDKIYPKREVKKEEVATNVESITVKVEEPLPDNIEKEDKISITETVRDMLKSKKDKTKK